jgi:hypothetical protein
MFDRKLKLLLNNLINTKIPNDIYINKGFKKKSDKLINNSFISDNILNYIYNTPILKSYTISSSSTNLTINITSYFINKISKKKILNIFFWLKSLSSNKNDKTIVIDIYLTPFKKKLNNQCTLTCEHVNTGVSINKEHIIIWRLEEFYKVLIHELIHLFHYDFADNNNNIITDLKKYINYDKSSIDYPNEAYVDFWAIVLNNLYNCYEISPNNKQNIINKFVIMMAKDIKFSMIQSSKILNHFKIDNMFDKLHKNTIKQTTNVFSYYIIKSALFFNIDIMFEFVKNFDYIKFDETNENLEKFKKIIFNCLHDNKYITYIKDIKLKNSYIFNHPSLRMSLF